MSDELIDIPGSDAQSSRTSRRSVRLFLIGHADDVAQIIGELHVRQFCETKAWSKPLRVPEPHQFALQPGEIMRVHKRYLTQ
ncbi:MAG: hypothetical protein Kow00121_09310 [Elainellaceae cyanobacterium]